MSTQTAIQSAPASPRPTTFNPKAPFWLKDLTFDEVQPANYAQVIGVLGRGMRDNPDHIAAFGPDPDVRRRSIERLFAGALGGMEIRLIAARRPDGIIVGVCGRIAPTSASRRAPRGSS
jgi:hypothetical protein